ncbi:YfiT family bacillithiol transferase [Paenibacillus tarimensis]
MNENLKYPIGIFSCPKEISEHQRKEWIREIEETPGSLKQAINGLSEEQLNTPYREGGWTVKQVVHHLADSHMNSCIRFKLALTEDNPTIKPYREELWAELTDSTGMDISVSLTLLESLHHRWVVLLESLSASDYERTFYHPESNEIVRLDRNLGLYAWHGKHHIAHITSLRERMGW